MKVLITGDPVNCLTDSIFLAGPTLRLPALTRAVSWRYEALRLLSKKNFQGSAYVPEPFIDNVQAQIDWENRALQAAKCILFWVPRRMDILPGLTTNIEFGEYMKSGKIVFGAPPEAVHVDYMRYKCTVYRIPQACSLEQTVDLAMALLQS